MQATPEILSRFPTTLSLSHSYCLRREALLETVMRSGIWRGSPNSLLDLIICWAFTIILFLVQARDN